MINPNNYFIKNYKPILVSFFLSTLLWLVVSTDKNYFIILEAPLHFSNLSEELAFKSAPPNTVKLKVSGSGRSLIAKDFYDIFLEIDLSDVKSTQSLLLTNYQKSLNLPANIDINVEDVLRPKKVLLEIDKRVRKNIPIRLNADIKPSAGYTLMNNSLSSDSVMLEGALGLVNKIKYIETNNITKKNVRYPFSESVHLLNPNPGVLELSKTKIRVKLEIEQIVERVLYNIPIQMVAVPPNLEAVSTPKTVTLRVKGGESDITALVSDELTVLFNYAQDYRKGTAHYPMIVQAPTNIDIVNISPEKFRIQLKKKVLK
jgi:hypothetical protein